MLRMEGWRVNHKRVQRIWRREGLRVPSKQPKRARLWLNDGSCVRLRPEYKDHVWAYDFERHEALLNRVEMKGLRRGGCRSSPREAGGSLISET